MDDGALKLAVVSAVVTMIGASLHLGAGVNITLHRLAPLPVWTLSTFTLAMAGLRLAGLKWHQTPCPATLLLLGMIGAAIHLQRRAERAAEAKRQATLEAEQARCRAALEALRRAGGPTAPWAALREALLVPVDPAVVGPVCAHDLQVLPHVRARLERERPAKVAVRCECGKEAQLPSEHAGRTVACKACGSKLEVPETAEGELILDVEALAAHLEKGQMFAKVVERLRAHAAAKS